MIIRILCLLALVVSPTAHADDAVPFSGSWRVVEQTSPHTVKKEGVEFGLVSIEFRKDKQCVFVFESSEGEAATFESSRRFVAGFDELALIGGDDFRNAAVEIYEWHKEGDEIVLVQELMVGGPNSPLPNTKGMSELEADLATKLSRFAKKVTVLIRLERQG